jgi:hypothetical protein
VEFSGCLETPGYSASALAFNHLQSVFLLILNFASGSRFGFEPPFDSSETPPQGYWISPDKRARVLKIT